VVEDASSFRANELAGFEEAGLRKGGPTLGSGRCAGPTGGEKPRPDQKAVIACFLIVDEARKGGVAWKDVVGSLEAQRMVLAGFNPEWAVDR